MNTELGTRLKAIRERIVASGVPLMDWDGVERELRRQRHKLRAVRVILNHKHRPAALFCTPRLDTPNI